MIQQIKNIFDNIAKYENNNFKINVENRLENSLKQYLLYLDNYYNRIEDNIKNNTIGDRTKWK